MTNVHLPHLLSPPWKLQLLKMKSMCERADIREELNRKESQSTQGRVSIPAISSVLSLVVSSAYRGLPFPVLSLLRSLGSDCIASSS